MTAPRIYTRCAAFAELQPLVRRPLAAWLADDELAELSRWRDAARRAQWLAGRALVKEIVSRQVLAAPLEPARIGVLSAAHAGAAAQEGGGPRVRLEEAWQAWSLSLAHASGYVLAAVVTAPGLRVGVDLVAHDEVRPAALGPWLGAGKRRGQPAGEAARLWALKEALYKATSHAGEPFAPATIEVVECGERWECRVAGQRLAGLRSLEARRVGGLWAALAVVGESRGLAGWQSAAVSQLAVSAARPLVAASAEEAAHVS